MAKTPAPTLSNEEKILLNLRALSRHFEAFEVPPRMTQEGMALYLGAQRPNVTRSLKSLMKKGLVSERMSHVTGHRRRKKVYLLTPAGLLQAQGLESSLRQHLGKGGKAEGLLERLLSHPHAGPDPSRHPGPAADGPTHVEVRPFFGRKEELEIFREWLSSKGCSMLMITGIAGIGKTTLARAGLSSEGRRSIWYRFYEANTLEGMLHEIGMGLGRLDRRELINHRSSASHQQSDPLIAAKALLRDLDGLDVVLVLDDFHLASPRTESFMKVLLGLLEGRGGMGCKAVVTSRQCPKFYNRRDVKVYGLVREMPLDGLDKQSSIELLKAKGVSLGDFEGYYAVTKGHPLALELTDSAGSVRAYKDALEFVREEIFQRLDQSERGLVERLCVFRQPVASDWFAGASPQGPSVLESLMDRGMVKRAGKGFELHGLIREYVRERLAKDTARSYHEMAAQYCEGTGQPRLSLLEAAHHRIQAGNPGDGARIIEENADGMVREGFFEIASVAEELLADPSDPGVRALVEYVLGRTWLELDDATAASQHLNDAHEALPQYPKDRRAELEVRICSALGAALAQYGSGSEAEAKLMEAARLYKGIKAPIAELTYAAAEAEAGIGGICKGRGDTEQAVTHYREALRLFALVDEPGASARMRYEVACLLEAKGMVDEAVAEYKEGLRLSEAAQDDHMLTNVSVSLGDLYSRTGQWEEARRCLEKGLTWATSPDDLLKTSKHFMQLTQAADDATLRPGLFERVKDYFSQRQTARSKSISRIYDRISALYLQREDWEQAARLHRQARDMFAKGQDLPNLAKAHNNLGMALKHMKDLDGAAMEYKAALDVLERTGDRRARGITCYNLAIAYEAMGDKEQMGKYLKMARDVFEGLGLKRELKALSELK